MKSIGRKLKAVAAFILSFVFVESLFYGESSAFVESEKIEEKPFDRIFKSSSKGKEIVPESKFELAGKKSALRIDADVPDAEVFLNGEFEGRTPLYISKITPGNYKITVKKPGYGTVRGVIRSEFGHECDYLISMKLSTAVVQLDVSADCKVLIDGKNNYRKINSKTYEVPVGSHYFSVKKFGYEESTFMIDVHKDFYYSVSFDWKSTPFKISSWDLSKKRINPNYHGGFSNCAINVCVNGPGSGKISVYDKNGTALYENEVSFTQWDNYIYWKGTDSNGLSLDEGWYEVELASGEFVEKKAVNIVYSSQYHPFDTTAFGSGIGSIPCAFKIPDGNVALGLVLEPTISSETGFYDFPFEVNCINPLSDIFESAFRGIVYPGLESGSFCASIGLKSVFEIPLNESGNNLNIGLGLCYGGMNGHVYYPYGVAKNIGFGTALMAGFESRNLFAGVTSEFVFGSSTSKLQGDNTWKNSAVVSFNPNLWTSFDLWFSNDSCFGFYNKDTDSVQKCERWSRAKEFGTAFSVMIPEISSFLRTSYSILIFEDESIYHEIKIGMNIIL